MCRGCCRVTKSCPASAFSQWVTDISSGNEVQVLNALIARDQRLGCCTRPDQINIHDLIEVACELGRSGSVTEEIRRKGLWGISTQGHLSNKCLHPGQCL